MLSDMRSEIHDNRKRELRVSCTQALTVSAARCLDKDDTGRHHGYHGHVSDTLIVQTIQHDDL